MYQTGILAAATVIALVCQATQTATADTHGQKVMAALAQQLNKSELDAAAVAQAKTVLEDGQEDPAAAITESLIAIYPEYAKAIDHADAEDLAAAVDTLTPLTKSPNKFLAADASFYLARTLMNGESYEQALPLLDSLTHDLAPSTAHQGTAQYFIGVAQAGLLDNPNAIKSFMAFLQFNPTAAERLRDSAWRKVQELQTIEQGKLSDVHQRMGFSRRRLELTETDSATQLQQKKIVRRSLLVRRKSNKHKTNPVSQRARVKDPVATPTV